MLGMQVLGDKCFVKKGTCMCACTHAHRQEEKVGRGGWGGAGGRKHGAAGPL